jgi:RNA polymerase sigma-70 factor (ECF subfamily)
MQDPADRRDVELSLAGDHGAFERIVGRYQNDIASTMWRFCRDRNTWEALVQETFVEAYFSLAGYGHRAPLLYWLRRIATRVGYRWLRNEYRHREREPRESHDVGHVASQAKDRNETAELAEWVHAMLGRLKPRDRLVLTLLYLEECTIEEAAARTGWSVSMVKVQAHRARKRLRATLDEADGRRGGAIELGRPVSRAV